MKVSDLKIGRLHKLYYKYNGYDGIYEYIGRTHNSYGFIFKLHTSNYQKILSLSEVHELVKEL